MTTRRICAACGTEADATAPAACPRCGERLIELRETLDPLVGTVIDDRFEVRARIGRGGMGAVYSAFQRDKKREVALKLVDSRVSSDAMGVRRFLREARLASQLNHPNTVRVLDFGQTREGAFFIAMELIRGRTLADLIDTEAPLSVERAARICIQLCDALEALHNLGILHRDLKPTNAMISERDELKVLDFGLAKSLREEESQATAIGLVMGTPGYIAPEMLKGHPASTASDLYSVGVILGEMVTGKHVWGVSATQEMQAVQARGMPAQLRAPVPMRPLLDRLLSPAPARRPQSAAQLRALLVPLAETGEAHISLPMLPPAQPEPPSRAGILMVALALVLGGAGIYEWRHAAAAPKTAIVAVHLGPQAAQAAIVPELPAQVTVHVRSTPPGAKVFVDGKESGTTPADLLVRRATAVTIMAEFGEGSGESILTPVGGETVEFRFRTAEEREAKAAAEPGPAAAVAQPGPAAAVAQPEPDAAVAEPGPGAPPPPPDPMRGDPGLEPGMPPPPGDRPPPPPRPDGRPLHLKLAPER